MSVGRLHRIEGHIGVELFGDILRRESQRHQNRVPCLLDTERAATLLDVAAHRLDSPQALALGQQRLIHDEAVTWLNDTANSFLAGVGIPVPEGCVRALSAASCAKCSCGRAAPQLIL